MSMGLGYGKIILFGEHFVVHDLPAIVAGLPWCTKASVQITQKSQAHRIILHDERPRIPGVTFIESKKQAYYQLAQNIIERMGVTQDVTITLAGDLVVSSGGIGASAATAVAITRALNNFYNVNIPDHEINQIALCGERAVHGNPSGIDTTAATYGGLFVFQKNISPRFLLQAQRTKIILIDSGFTTPTSEVITSVQNFKDNHQELVHMLVTQYKNIVQEAEFILSKKLQSQAHDNLDNLVRLGELMNRNHELLRQIGVSTPELDEIVLIARNAGAFGAKITGTGRGGLILALTPGDIQERVSRVFSALGYNVICTEIQV